MRIAHVIVTDAFAGAERYVCDVATSGPEGARLFRNEPGTFAVAPAGQTLAMFVKSNVKS